MAPDDRRERPAAETARPDGTVLPAGGRFARRRIVAQNRLPNTR